MEVLQVASSSRAPLFLLLGLAACGGGGGEARLAVAPDSEEDQAALAPPGTRDSAVAAPAVMDSSLIPEPGSELVREDFSYSGGNRDPFASLLEGKSIGPELGDLDVVGLIYVERNPESSAAVLRDRVNRKQYTAREGERVGRARVISVGATTVTFTIDDFGTQREVTLAMRKREDVP